MYRLGVTPGLIAIGCLLAVSGWWLLQFGLRLDQFSPALAAVSFEAMKALLLLQLLSVSLFSPHWSVAIGEQPSHRRALLQSTAAVASSLVPAWPLFAMLSLASGVSMSSIGLCEAALLAMGIVFAQIGRAFHYLELDAEIMRLSQTLFGVFAAALAWLYGNDWLQGLLR